MRVTSKKYYAFMFCNAWFHLFSVRPAVNITVWPPTDNWVTINSSLKITCEVVEGSLPMYLTMTHPSSEEMDVSSNVTAINSSVTISISSTSDGDYGIYTCVVSNILGKENETIWIQEGCKSIKALAMTLIMSSLTS